MKRYTWVDSLRGFAAVAVLFVHFPLLKEFRFGDPVTRGELPVDWLFGPFYDHGALAVPLFWIISGFVFRKVYSDPAISAGRFALMRFSRLYPLHFVTLIILALMQWWSLRTTGNFEIVQFNDAYHFVLQLFFASNWGFERGYSFNGPIWSVSVEVLIYAVYFIYLKSRQSSVWLAVIMSAAFFLVSHLTHSNPIALCGSLFFLGSAIAYLKPRAAWVGVGAVTLATTTTIAISLSPISRHTELAVQFLVFPALVLLAGWAEAEKREAPRIFQRVGDLTYGIYLVHTPILVAMKLTLGPGVSLGRLVIYLLAVAVTARLAYQVIELPAQRRLRSRTASPRPCEPPAP